MTPVVYSALAAWGFDEAQVRLVAMRENAVYEIATATDKYALRLHRVGYRTDAELISELEWMAGVARSGLSVPAPVPARDGQVLHLIGGYQVDVLGWLAGDTMDDALPLLAAADRAQMFFDLGQVMARLHLASDVWTPPPGFSRWAWDQDGLLGGAPLWDRFWDNPELDAADRALFMEFRAKAAARLDQIGPSLDYGLIHADLVPGNVLVDGRAVQLIDFDDGGFGFRIFEVATALLKHRAEPDFANLSDRLLAGYRAVRPLDTQHLDFFLALRAATYVGWNITRMDEPGGVDRNGRFIDTLRALVVALP